MRFVRIVVFLAAVAAIAAPSASALAFNDSNFPLPDAVDGTPYKFQLTAHAGCPPYIFAVVSGSLPAGITLSSDGLLSGTPTGAGTAAFWIELGDKGCNSPRAQRPFTLNVKTKVTVTTNSVPAGTVGVPYSTTLAAVGGSPLTWTIVSGVLPDGVTLAADGTVSGTPTTAGSTTVIFKASLADGRSDTKQLTFVVLAPLAVATPPTVLPAEVGRPLRATPPAATGGLPPYVWSIVPETAPPPGVVVDPATGALSGIPLAAGTFAVKIGLTDANGSSVTLDLTITVAPRVGFTTLRLPAGEVGVPYEASFGARGGVEPFKWRAVRGGGSFPPGIRLNRATGELAGIPRRSGTYHFSIIETDSLGGSVTRAFTLVIRP